MNWQNIQELANQNFKR